jgi:hypothetical protein
VGEPAGRCYNLPSMRSGSIYRVFFILYCLEAGLFLLFVPWSHLWDRTMMQVSLLALRGVLLHPMLRGAVSGFGLVHLVWGLHDLQSLLFRSRREG